MVVQNNGKEIYNKKTVLHVQSCFLLLIRRLIFFAVLVAIAV